MVDADNKAEAVVQPLDDVAHRIGKARAHHTCHPLCRKICKSAGMLIALVCRCIRQPPPSHPAASITPFTAMNDSSAESSRLPRYRFWIMVRRLRVGILTTRSDKGVLTARHVMTCNTRHDAGGVLRFLVSADWLWLRDISLDPNVSVAYADWGHNQFLSVSGQARVKRCLVTQQALWNPAWEREHPAGACDPLLRILEVRIGTAFLQDGLQRLELTYDDFRAPTAEVNRPVVPPLAVQPTLLPS